MRKEPWDVLQEDEARSHLTNDPSDIGPEPAVVVGSLALAGDGERLTWKSRRDEIHDSTPRRAIEGCEIVPDRRLIQGRVFHPRHESGRCEGFPLNVTCGSIPVSESEADPKLETSNPGT